MSHVGIHISNDVTRCVEIKHTKNMGSIKDATDYSNPAGLISDGDIVDFKVLVDHFKEIKKRFKKSTVTIAVPSKSSVSTVIRLPEMAEAEMRSTISFELEKYIKRGLPSEYMWDFATINESLVDSDRQKVKQISVFVSAVNSAYITEVLEAAKKAGLKVDSVETEEMALWRTYNTMSHLNYLGVHIGGHETEVLSVHRGNLYYIRPKLPVTLKDIMPINEEDLSVVVDRTEEYSDLTTEMSRTMEHYSGKLRVPLDNVIISAEGTLSPTVLSNLQIDMGVNTSLWTLPKDVFIEGTRITSELDSDVIDHTYAISFGLSLRASSSTRINLIPKEYIKKSRLALVRRVALVTVALLVVSVGSFTFYVMMLENKQTSLTSDQAQLVATMDQGTQLSTQISVLQNEISGVNTGSSDTGPSISTGDVMQYLEKNIPKDVKIHNIKYDTNSGSTDLRISAVSKTNQSVGVLLLRLKRLDGISDAKVTKILEYTYEGKTYLAFEIFVSTNGGGLK